VSAMRDGLPAGCPVDRLLRLLWGEWTTHILWLLGEKGPLRFGSLQAALDGISAKVLTARLRRMEEDGLLWREVEGTTPPRVTYGLTASGNELHERLLSLEDLAERWFDQPTTRG